MIMALTVHGLTMGWHPDLPDFRDYTGETEAVQEVLAESPQLRKAARSLPKSVDLRPWCSPIEDQGRLGSCTAQAGVGLYEYFERRAHNKHVDGSRLFLYKVTRKLMGLTGDTGAYLRDTMKGLVVFGVPPERYWPYRVEQYDAEPTAFLYTFAQAFQALKYYRLDPPAARPDEILVNVRRSLAGQLPSMFGFTVYESIPPSGDGKGEIPMPAPSDAVAGGHAVLAVGYDDDKRIGSAKGALLIRNSWGTGWGMGGYGWLPYDYILASLADDFWTLVSGEFVDSDIFR
jgi:C1A family cysteine protease